MQIVTLASNIVLNVTTAACERLLAEELIDIVGLPVNPKGFTDMQANPTLLAKVAWEISDKRMSFESFMEIVDGDSLPILWDAVTKAIVDFFRGPMRAIVAALIEKAKDQEAAMAQNMMEVIHGVPSEDGEQFGNLQGLSELTPDHSVFVSSTTWPEEDSEQSGAAIVA